MSRVIPSQATINKLVYYLKRLGYTLEGPGELELAKTAIREFRSSKAAARFFCATMGGTGNCLTPLADARLSGAGSASKLEATRIPSPDEIRLSGQKASLPKAVTSMRPTPLPPMPSFPMQLGVPKVPKAPKGPGWEAKAERAAAKKSTPATPSKAKAPKAKKASKPDKAKAAKVKELAPLVTQLEANTKRQSTAERKAIALAEQANNKRLRKSKRQKASAAVDKLLAKSDDLARANLLIQRDLNAGAEKAGLTVEEAREAVSAKRGKRMDAKLLKQARDEQDRLDKQMETAKALLAAEDAKQAGCPCDEPKAKKAARPPQAAPATPVDDGTKLVNSLAAQLLANRK